MMKLGSRTWQAARGHYKMQVIEHPKAVKALIKALRWYFHKNITAQMMLRWQAKT